MVSSWLFASLALAVAHSAADPNCNTFTYPFIKDTTVTFPTGTVTTYLTTRTTTTTAPRTTVTNYRGTTVVTIYPTVNIPYYKTVAPSTKTAPTSKGFIPFASLKPSSPKPQKYNATVFECLTQVTSRSTLATFITFVPDITKSSNVLSTSTETLDTTVFTTRTVSASVATVYAGCQNSANLASTYKGAHLNNIIPINAGNYYPILPSGPAFQAAGQSPVDCCNAVHAAGQTDSSISGFAYIGDEIFCTPLGIASANKSDLNGFQFFTGPGDVGFNNLVLGAGPRDPPLLIYGGVCQAGNCNFTNQDYVIYGDD